MEGIYCKEFKQPKLLRMRSSAECSKLL
uniref:Uncharacterized protein n=1 Tax=Anguilla anguilla TaxID=7936 RepID=A0A0E9W504_ANGAN